MNNGLSSLTVIIRRNKLQPRILESLLQQRRLRPVNEVAKLAVMGHVNIYILFFCKNFFFKEFLFFYF